MDHRKLGALLAAMAATAAAATATAAATAAPAAAEAPPQPAAPAQPTVTATAAEHAGMPGLEAFVDGVVAASMAGSRIPGVQLAVVSDGVAVLVKGYGMASLDPPRGVDPARTLFRIGSISKTFTWLAIMQLAEQGRLALGDDVNQHLPADLQIPDDGFANPIRIVDLLNHTPGFEDTAEGLFVFEDADLRSLARHLGAYRPRRVREPGVLPSYSNYGAALAGAVVAHLAGEDYESYVDRRILRPLGLDHTTFREAYGPAAPPGLPAPMSEELAADRAVGLEWSGGAGTWKAAPHEHILGMAPAGAAVSTATDMARYMIALGSAGQLEGSAVLSPASYAELTAESFRAAPGLRPIRHGFFDAALGQRSVLGRANRSHGGATLHFLSNLVLVPELGLGIFVAVNSRAGGVLMQGLPEQIITRYHPAAATGTPVPSPDFAKRAQDYLGTYLPTRRSYTKLEKIVSALEVQPVTLSDDGYLVMKAGKDRGRFVEVGPDLFRKVDGDARFWFKRDARGAVTHMVSGAGSAERIDFFASPVWLLLAGIAGAGTSVVVLAGAWRRHRTGIAAAGQTRWQRGAERMMTALAAGWLVFFVVFGVWAAGAAGDSDEGFVRSYPHTSLKMALAALLMSAAGTVAAIVATVPAARGGGWSRGRLARHALALLVWLVFVTTAQQWNMLGFRYF